MKGFVAEQGGQAATPAAAAPAAPAPTQAARPARSPALFKALGERLAKNPALAGDVGALLQFHIKSPDASYVVDLRSAPGSVREGQDNQAAAVFTLAEEDFLQLLQDPARAKDLYMHGKLRVDGDVRLAQRLGFLKQLG